MRFNILARYSLQNFEWPRERTGVRIADSLDLAPPTFHQYLRKAQQKAFDVALHLHFRVECRSCYRLSLFGLPGRSVTGLEEVFDSALANLGHIAIVPSLHLPAIYSTGTIGDGRDSDA